MIRWCVCGLWECWPRGKWRLNMSCHPCAASFQLGCGFPGFPTPPWPWKTSASWGHDWSTYLTTSNALVASQCVTQGAWSRCSNAGTAKFVQVETPWIRWRSQYIPGTLWWPLFDWKLDLVLEGWFTTKIKDKQVLGIYIYISSCDIQPSRWLIPKSWRPQKLRESPLIPETVKILRHLKKNGDLKERLTWICDE